ncbi:uncharacterized protein EAE98_006142 [Botrytis deweyae]|uniref:Azaphilone pigments biosynthesis cluster protein L N-terminal domain-containing protein n=1 Tax=Botrytis deweyae TaxID=2478750 RepID=A0ABQ7ILR6_9HELO|nr:uncharacterized protein EAE98_006142 [Botrytis deweyae]KAF7927760.1 hypothetical protein EAE98_006142 [Botrytis deweyae]
MADPVGLTASVIGIATLAVQLGDALRKAAEFWEAVQDAPSDIRRLSKQLRLVASVFHTIRLEYEAGSIPTNFESMVNDALELAKDDIDQLSEFISVLSRKLSVANGSLGRQWRKVQMVLKASKIERFRDNLESVKTTMALLQGSRQQASLIQVSSRLDVLSTNISSIATTNSTHQIALQTSQEMTHRQLFPSGGWKCSAGSVSKSFNQYKTNFLLGTLNFRTISTTRRYNDDDGTDDADNSTTTKTFLVELLMGFTTCRKGLRFMATSNFDRYALDVVRRRPDDSAIFELCRYGNVQAVRRLLDRGEASVHDVDEDGESLLHIAFSNDNSQLCTMLIDLGADLYWEDDYGIISVFTASTLPSFAAIFEAGFELWPLYESRSHLAFFNPLSISVWRYIFQQRPAQSIGSNFSLFFVQQSIRREKDAEVVDFLVARFAEEFFQLGAFDSYYCRNLAENMILSLVNDWLKFLFNIWFHGARRYRVVPFEYKLALILKQILIPSYSCKSNKKHILRTITGIYISGVGEIMKACFWSLEITTAIFRIWSKPFFELGIDLFSRHPYIIRGNGDHGYEDDSDGEDSDGENSDGEDSDKESTAHPALRWHMINCCRDTYFEIIHEDQHENLSLKITSFTRPEYSHLDPLFLCEAGRKRRDRNGAGRCLSQVDEAFIESGKFSMNMPGQWEERLLPNSAMELTLQSPPFEPPQICYSMVQELDEDWYTIVTEADFQRIEENLRNGTLYGLSKDSPKRPGEE